MSVNCLLDIVNIQKEIDIGYNYGHCEHTCMHSLDYQNTFRTFVYRWSKTKSEENGQFDMQSAEKQDYSDQEMLICYRGVKINESASIDL